MTTKFICERCGSVNKTRATRNPKRHARMHRCNRYGERKSCGRLVCGNCYIRLVACVDCITDEDRAEWREESEERLAMVVRSFAEKYGLPDTLAFVTDTLNRRLIDTDPEED